jgi:hypothetical protein
MAVALRTGWLQSAETAASQDITRPLPFAVLALAFFAARLPFLFYGYGTDPDSWRVALTGRYLLAHGQYFPSRLPGYPLQEFLVAPLTPLGSVATNLETAVASLAGVYLFGRIVLWLQLPRPALLTVAFAFTPLLIINSVSTMDYMWTLTFILGAYYALLRDRVLVAGALVGAAVGFRVPAVIAGLPLAYLLFRQGRWREVIPMGLLAIGVAIIARTPPLVVYGPRTFNFYDASVDYKSVARLLAKEGLGVFGAVAVLVGIALSLSRLRSFPRDLVNDPQVGAWTIMVLATLLVFFRLPHKIGYLLPLFPFGYFLLGRYLSRPALSLVVLAILAAGLIDITIHEGPLNPSSLRNAGIGKGLLLSNVETMQNQTEFVREVLASPVPDHSVVMVGFVYPQLAVRTWERFDVGIVEKDYEAISMLSDRGQAIDKEHDIRYVWLLTYPEFEALRSEGYAFFLVPDAAGGAAALYDYRPALFGAEFLNLGGASPSLGKQSTAR